MSFKRFTILLALLLTIFAVSAKAHECPPGSIQMVDYYPCNGNSPNNPPCNFYTHYCFECASVEGVLTIKSLSWLITANPDCFGTNYTSCITYVMNTIIGNMSNPIWWQTYSNQLCFNQFGGARPCLTPPKTKVFTYFPICWYAKFESNNGGTNQYSFNPCLLSNYCVIEWEVCWDSGTNTYSWTLVNQYLEGNGPSCNTVFSPLLLTPLTVGQSTSCFHFSTATCP